MLTASPIAVALCASAQGTTLSLAGWRVGCGVSGRDDGLPGSQLALQAVFGKRGSDRICMPSKRFVTNGAIAGGTGDYPELD